MGRRVTSRLVRPLAANAASLLELAGLVALVVFAGSWGWRWAVLAAAVVLLVVGTAVGGDASGPTPPVTPNQEGGESQWI